MKVDKSLDKKMRVDLNITFPALHCNDLHIDIMDIAGDAHNDVHDTMEKTRLHIKDGSVLSEDEIRVLLNNAHQKEVDKLEAIDKSLVDNYCGPCYGRKIVRNSVAIIVRMLWMLIRQKRGSMGV